MKFILTIAGSDPTGGAGIQADLKTISALGCYGLSAVTAITSQTTKGMQSSIPVDPSALRSQVMHLYSDFKISAVKIGMISLAENAKTIAEILMEKKQDNVVVDPVIFSGTGLRLLDDSGIENLKNFLLCNATIVTPNLMEASILADMNINGVEDMGEAARRIAKFGSEAVLVKGGHLAGDPVDVLYHRRRIILMPGKRIQREIHGAGCALSSAIASCLAQGIEPEQAVRTARDFTSTCIRGGFRISKKGKFLLKHL